MVLAEHLGSSGYYIMCFVLSNCIANDVLCYLSTARHSLGRDTIVANSVAFYSVTSIIEAKQLIFKTVGQNPITRKKCQTHPNPLVADINDVLSLLDKTDEDGKKIPDFVASKFNSLPPSGFEAVASVICSLRDEISAVKHELSQIRETNQCDVKLLEDVGCVKHDVSDIKMSLSRANLTINQDVPLQSCSDSVLTYAAATVAQNKPGASVQLETNVRPTKINVATVGVKKPDENAWRLVRNGKRKKELINGSRLNGTDGLTAAPTSEKSLDLFLGGCGDETTVEQVKTYCGTIGFTARVSSLETKANYKAYKISVAAGDRDLMLDSSLWPQGLFVRKFFTARTKGNSNVQVLN